MARDDPFAVSFFGLYVAFCIDFAVKVVAKQLVPGGSSSGSRGWNWLGRRRQLDKLIY